MYSKNQEPELDLDLFESPTSDYRGFPFWAWNNKLNKEQLVKQIDYFEEMGMGGFHMHCRTGLDTSYLKEEFMDCVRACIEKAKKDDLYACLYDEDRWPSGAAGGYVTKDERFRSRYLVFSPQLTDESDEKASRRTLLGAFKIVLADGYLASYNMVDTSSTGDNIWYLYLEISAKSPWHNNETYLDTLNKAAVEEFIKVTHEKYYSEFKSDFGVAIPSIFTDEPQFTRKNTLRYAQEKAEIVLPYTDAFEAGYKQKYGESFLAHFPELIWDLPDGKISVVRYRYHDYLGELFASSFADTIGEWCGDHNIMLTGHMMEEPTLHSQTSALGDAMRSYRSFTQPGIDMLCDWREYTTAKQAQSATHQFEYQGVLSELYGVTNWNFDFRGHKLQGDWQAALGVTTRVHHLSWVSMNGEAKRDYPASIFYQSPWYKEYKTVEDHFARTNTILTRGKPSVKVGVIHPIETYWLHYGPSEQTYMVRSNLENMFESLAEWLLFSQIDFDYISESLLPVQNDLSDEKSVLVGAMNYDVIIVAGCETLRKTTLDYLTKFKNNGGEIIFAGDTPNYVDAIPSDKVLPLAKKSVQLSFSKPAIIEQLEAFREILIRKEDGTIADHLIYQKRIDTSCSWLFIANGKRVSNPDIPTKETLNIKLYGEYNIECYNTMTGEIFSVDSTAANGWTTFTHAMYLHDSLMLKLLPKSQASTLPKPAPAKVESSRFTVQNRVDIRLQEPNVLMLDQAEYKFDNGEWQPCEEILRLDNEIRKSLHYPLRMEQWAQPWTNTSVITNEHEVSIRYIINSDIDVANPTLAIEPIKDMSITLNNTAVNISFSGYFVDECIKTIPLPNIKSGKSELLIKFPFGEKTDLEWCYLLGDFGVKTEGRFAKIIAKENTVCFGDYSSQSLPFYSGNLDYIIPVDVAEGDYTIKITKFRSTVLQVKVDGIKKGNIAFQPYELDLGHLSNGQHTIEITAFGNRINAFGAVHNCDESIIWHGPSAWRTEGDGYSYEYQLKPMGILKAPILIKTI